MAARNFWIDSSVKTYLETEGYEKYKRECELEHKLMSLQVAAYEKKFDAYDEAIRKEFGGEE
jgi:hypothetical protein